MGKRLGPLLIAASAIVMWLSSRATWVVATSEDDKSGSASNDLVGAAWSLELMAVTLLLLAGALAGFALRRLGRRVVGIVCAVAAAAAAWSPVALLTYGVDTERAQRLLQSADDNKNVVDSASISDWAVVTGGQVHALGPVLALLAAALGIVGGVVLAMRPGADGARSNKYETVAARKEMLAQDLEEDPDSGRVMWDALDADIDPTDLGQDAKRSQ